MKNLSIILILVATLFFIECAGNSKKADTAATNDIQLTTVDTRKGNSVKMYMKKSTYPPGTEQVELSVVNDTDEEAVTGEHYTLYRYIDENWQQLPLELFFIEIAYIIGPGESRDFTISLHTDMYDYQKGQYRVEKNVGGQLLNAEFELK